MSAAMKHRPVALVTGASSGIGRQTAVQLAERGMRIVAVGRRRDALEQTLGMLAGDGHLLHVANLGDRKSTAGVVRRVAEQQGRLDVLVNNAGVARAAPLDGGIRQEDLREHVELNAIAPATLIAAAWPLLRAQSRACIVNVSSMATVDPFPGFFSYALSKASMNLMVKSCANEGHPDVRAFGIAPGCVETPLLRQLFDEAAVPRSMAISPDDVATLIVECIEGKWDAHNGKVIAIASEDGQVVRRPIEG